MSSITAHDHDHAHDDNHGHPSLNAYVRIALVLGVITAIEVAIYYIPAFEGVLVPLLIALSAVKFVIVVGYFMHLKFDDKMLTFIFSAALIASMVIFIGLWAVTHFDAASVFHGNMSIFPDKPERP